MPKSFLVKKTKNSDIKHKYDRYMQDVSRDVAELMDFYKAPAIMPSLYPAYPCMTYDDNVVLSPEQDDTKENQVRINFMETESFRDCVQEQEAAVSDSEKSENGSDVTKETFAHEPLQVADGRSKRHNKPLLENLNKQRYTCNDCGRHYATSSNLSRHKQTHRNPENCSSKCPHCGKVYASSPALSMHILTHDLKHVCHVCNKSFSRPWLLQGHLRSHTGERPYGCAHCGKTFADRSNLRAHMQTHSGSKSFQCKRCDKTFALKSYLNKHYESTCTSLLKSDES